MIIRFILALCFLTFSSVPSFAETVVAVVGEKKITLEDFKQKYEDVKKQALNVPEPDLFLEDLVRFEVGVQEAEKRGMQNDPIVKERFRQELYKALLERAIGQKVQGIQVNEAEMRKYYQNNPELRLSHILIEFKTNANEQEKKVAKTRALEVLDEVKKSKRPFEELAKLYTDDSLSKNTGGDVGFHSRVTIAPQVYETALQMKVGDVRGPIETLYGFHIIKLTSKRPYQEANKRQLRAAVFDEKRRDVFNAFFKDLKTKYKIQLNKSALNNI